MRFVVLLSLAVGTVLDANYGPYQGKETGETALFRALHQQLDDGDILLADRYFCSYFEIALLQEREENPRGQRDLFPPSHGSRSADGSDGRFRGRRQSSKASGRAACCIDRILAPRSPSGKLKGTQAGAEFTVRRADSPPGQGTANGRQSRRGQPAIMFRILAGSTPASTASAHP
jgi:hypothetical protein